LQDEEYYRPFETEPQFSTSKDWYCDYLLPYVFIQANVRNIIPQNCCAGIGRPSEEMGAISFVLGSFSNQEKEEVCNFDACKFDSALCPWAVPVTFFLEQTLVSP